MIEASEIVLTELEFGEPNYVLHAGSRYQRARGGPARVKVRAQLYYKKLGTVANIEVELPPGVDVSPEKFLRRMFGPSK